MIHPKRLLDDLKRLLRRLEADLRERAGAVAELAELLQREYRAAREAGRTGESFEMWRDGTLTQAAAAWLLGCVFVRFLEDNGLVEEALLSGHRRSAVASRLSGRCSISSDVRLTVTGIISTMCFAPCSNCQR